MHKGAFDSGAYTVAQSESTSVVYGMVAGAVKAGAVRKIVDLDDISNEIVSFANGLNQKNDLGANKRNYSKKIDHEFVLPLSIIDTSVQMEKLDSKESEFLDVISCAKMALYSYKNIKYLLSESSR